MGAIKAEWCWGGHIWREEGFGGLGTALLFSPKNFRGDSKLWSLICVLDMRRHEGGSGKGCRFIFFENPNLTAGTHAWGRN